MNFSLCAFVNPPLHTRPKQLTTPPSLLRFFLAGFPLGSTDSFSADIGCTPKYVVVVLFREAPAAFLQYTVAGAYRFFCFPCLRRKKLFPKNARVRSPHSTILLSKETCLLTDLLHVRHRISRAETLLIFSQQKLKIGVHVIFIRRKTRELEGSPSA